MIGQKNALISVFRKERLPSVAHALHGLGWNLYASGGTASAIQAEGLPVTDVASLVGGGAILGHRVVTLSREVHAGLLARPDNSLDMAELQQLNIPFFDFVWVDLYPLEETIGLAGATVELVKERTDIGGPTLLRAAAKGERIVVSDTGDLNTVLDWMHEGCPNDAVFRLSLAAKAEAVVAQYALLSANFLGQGEYTGFVGHRAMVCKYGENAWQTPAALYNFGVGGLGTSKDSLAVGSFELVYGDAPSYNNEIDLERVLQTVTHIAAGFEVNFGSVPFIAVGVKHGNACGASIGSTPEEAIERMVTGDPVALFGGVVMLNFPVTKELAHVLLNHKTERVRLLDTVVAAGFDPGVEVAFKRKDGKCRLLSNAALAGLSEESLDTAIRFRYTRGGFATQPNYTFVLDLNAEYVQRYGERELTDQRKQDMVLAWAVGSTSNSNTITLVYNGKVVGNGVGQQDRVTAAGLARSRANSRGHSPVGTVAYSDSFFPFDDGPRVLAEAGVKFILTTSGSVRDADTIEVCRNHDIGLVMVPDKLARGFFGH